MYALVHVWSSLNIIWFTIEDSGIQNYNHKYWAYLIWIKCSLLLDSAGLNPTGSFLVCIPPHTSHFLIKSKECLRDLCSTGRKGQGEIVFLSICHADEAPGHGAVLFYTVRLREGEKEELGETCSGFQKAHHYYLLLLCSASYASVHMSLTTSVCQGGQDFTHLLRNISSVCRQKKKKKETSARGGQTNQFERPDKCNKPKVYFSAPSKWVLRYCITLFI